MRNVSFIVISLLCSVIFIDVAAQPHIARIQPDAIAPGMTIALEILALERDSGAFGRDGLATSDIRIVLNRLSDSDRVVFGPHVVSWNGRLIQVPVMVLWSATLGNVDFHIERGFVRSDSVRLRIVQPGPAISIFGNGIIGDGSSGGSLTDGNTLVVESIELTSQNPFSDVFRFAVTDINGSPINKRLHPMTILSRGAVRVRKTTLSVSADTINGGPGGGGGGAGYAGVGGYGYTGGGTCDTVIQSTWNVGSAFGSPPITFGGSSTTGVRGGKSDETDQGGGGGTGDPFGTSGLNGGQNSFSFDGGFGGASGGGEATGGPFGGGGGGFATAGANGSGIGDNGGQANGGKFLAPAMGGGGGGAGNSFFREDSLGAGSGGGGGGALTIIGYGSVDILDNARISADGAHGTPGKYDREGGGGGGSGGGIVIGTRSSLNLQNAIFSANRGLGGNGGGSYATSARGGNGGMGRIRFDAQLTDTCTSCTGHTTYGPTLSIPPGQLATQTIKLSGFAGVGSDLADSVRIYYRTRHTSWAMVSTVRKKFGSVFVWEKFINAPPDSLLFVCVYVKVNAPSRSFANYEPDWLLGHVSSGIISIKPRSELVASPDTLDLGCIKTGNCLDGLVYIENKGEAPLAIDTVYTTNDALFMVTDYPSLLNGYEPRSIAIRYCPQQERSDTAQLVIVAGDSTYRKTILFGCGLDKVRSITIIDSSRADFLRVHVDSCKERTIVIRSNGPDPITLDLDSLIRPPFFVIDPTTTVITLDSGVEQVVKIQFCPKDTGFFATTFIITERRDSFVVRGVGTTKVFIAPDTFRLGAFCKGRCIDTSFTIYSIGNDFVDLGKINHDTNLIKLRHPLNPQQLSGGASDKVEFSICFDSVGEHTDTISYPHDADTPPSTHMTVLHYSVVGLALAKDDIFDLGTICTGACDSLTTSVRNLSSAFTVTSATLNDTTFKLILPQSPITVNKNDSLIVKLNVCTKTAGELNDTLTLHIAQGDCDTTITIPVRAFGADAALVLSSDKLIFDETDSGSCSSDTVFLQNPCETNISASFPERIGVFERLEPSASQVSIVGNSSVRVIYQFCPQDSLVHDAEDTILYNGSKIILGLSGKGRIEDVLMPHIVFRLDRTQSVVYEAFSYNIYIDSVTKPNAITNVTASLGYDPIVTMPTDIAFMQDKWQINGNEFVVGHYSISANGPSLDTGLFATITMKALNSRRDSTGVILENVSITPTATQSVANGSIKVLGCDVPPGNIVIPGEFVLGDPTPNPLRGAVSIPVKLGAAGRLNLKLYNAQGGIVYSSITEHDNGEHILLLDASNIPAGYYILEAESWGWRERKSVLIVK